MAYASSSWCIKSGATSEAGGRGGACDFDSAGRMAGRNVHLEPLWCELCRAAHAALAPCGRAVGYPPPEGRAVGYPPPEKSRHGAVRKPGASFRSRAFAPPIASQAEGQPPRASGLRCRCSESLGRWVGWMGGAWRAARAARGGRAGRATAAPASAAFVCLDRFSRPSVAPPGAHLSAPSRGRRRRRGVGLKGAGVALAVS